MARERRQRSFSFIGEEALVRELFSQLLEGGAQSALAGQFDVIDDGLKVAPRFVDREPASRQDGRPVGQSEADEAIARGEHHAAELGGVILEAEIPVSGCIGPEVGDFAFDPDGAKVALHQKAGFGGDLADATHLPTAGGSRSRLTRHLSAGCRHPRCLATVTVAIGC